MEDSFWNNLQKMLGFQQGKRSEGNHHTEEQQYEQISAQQKDVWKDGRFDFQSIGMQVSNDNKYLEA